QNAAEEGSAMTHEENPQPSSDGRTPVPTPEQWAAQFQQEHGREPSMSEYQAALAAGVIAAPGEQQPRIPDPSLQQMRQGFSQVAAGAKNLYGSRVAPALAQSVERSGAKQFYTDR